MDPVERFQEYADAFEVVFENDDWSLLEPYFTESAVYEIVADAPLGGSHQGRDAVFAYLKQSLASFDRRFESRQVDILEGPTDVDGAVLMRWRITYRAGAAPPLVMEGEEIASFEGDRISRLEDRFSPTGVKEMLTWMGEHASELKDA